MLEFINWPLIRELYQSGTDDSEFEEAFFKVTSALSLRNAGWDQKTSVCKQR